MTGIGPKEASLIAAVSGKGLRVFTVADAAEMLNISRVSASDMVLRLLAKKKLIRIEKGRYLLIPPEAWNTGEYTEEGVIVASQLVKPYYLSYWTALSFYGWTEQPSKTLFIATTKLKRSLSVQGTAFKFVRLRPGRFFGFSEQWVGNQKVAVAEKEKAIIDCLDQPRYAGEIVEIAKGLWNGRSTLDYPKLLNYALKMKNGTVIKRLGYLMEILKIENLRVINELKKYVTPGIMALDPSREFKAAEISRRWNLYINVNQVNLTEWKTH
jgi:predicted transcriptional regulator of viral defense system